MRQKKKQAGYAINEIRNCKFPEEGILIHSLHLDELVSGSDPHPVCGEEMHVSLDGWVVGQGKSSTLKCSRG